MLERYDSRNNPPRRVGSSSLEPYSQVARRDSNRSNNDLDIFSNHGNNLLKSMDTRFENIHSQMMKQFDGAFRSPFMENPFGMMNQVSNQINNMFAGFSDLHEKMMSGGTQGTQISKVFSMQRRIGRDNQPEEEKYFSTNVVQRDQQGNTISERKQAYRNTAEQRDAIAQERMLNSQGRKFVQERINGQTNSTNHYLNLDEGGVNAFDDQWNNASDRMGFFKNASAFMGIGNGQINRPRIQQQYSQADDGYGGETLTPDRRRQYQLPQKQLRSQKDYKEYDFQDDGRHGDFIPSSVKRSEMPVRVNKGFDGYGRRETDIKPTQPGYRQLGQDNNNGNIQAPQSYNNYSNVQNMRAQQAANVQQRPTVVNLNSVPPRQNNQIPLRNAAENGVFINRQVPKGAIPRAG